MIKEDAGAICRREKDATLYSGDLLFECYLHNDGVRRLHSHGYHPSRVGIQHGKH